mmetsp:Transcript_38199/g.106436  ORF Transcript_38199/g.106436 Transcript_38199/m.106436 type:complete len:391 (-) Transcript_38199:40-1212(-)
MTFPHLLVDLSCLCRVQLCIQRDAIKLEPPDKVCRTRGLDLVQEERLLRWVPVRVPIVELAVGAPDVCADQNVLDRLSPWRPHVREHLDGLLSNLLSRLQKLLGDIVASDDVLLLVLRGHRRHVGNSIQELAVEPEAPCLPIPGKAFDGLLHNELGAMSVVLEVIRQDLRIRLAFLNGELEEAKAKTTLGLLHHKRFPSARFDLLQQLCWAASSLEREDGGRHGDAGLHACLHVLGLVQDEVLYFPRGKDVCGLLERLQLPRSRLVVFHADVDGVVAHREVDVIGPQALQGELLRGDDVDLDVLVLFLNVPCQSSVAMDLPRGARLAIHQVLVTHRVHPPLVRQIGKEGRVADVRVQGACAGVFHEIRVLAADEPNPNRRHCDTETRTHR